MLILSGVKNLLLARGERLLGDSGYSASVCIVPDATQNKEWNNKQKGLRSIVERLIGLVMTYAAAHQVFRSSPEQQTMALMSIYHLVQHYVDQHPLVVEV